MRPAPDKPGFIRYQIYAWNQWMQNGENLVEYVIQVPNRAPNSAEILLTSRWLPLPPSQNSDDLIIDARTYSRNAEITENAAKTITTANSVIIASGANVIFSAGQQIHLTPGFHAEAGSGFRTFTTDDTANASLSVDSLYYGQSVFVTGKLSDPDKNLKGHNLWVNPPEAVVSGSWLPVGRTLNPDWWGGPQSESGWSGVWANGAPSNNATSVVRGQFTPDRVGTWQLRTNGCDDHGVWGLAATKNLTVVATPPTGNFSGRGLSEGMALTLEHLYASFMNPYNGGWQVPGSITYTIASGGNSIYPNGAVLSVGNILPAGNYVLRASIPASANYTASSVDAAFLVMANPDADNDNDGLSNGIEADLGLDPNVPGRRDPSALEINIHTPTSNP